MINLENLNQYISNDLQLVNQQISEVISPDFINKIASNIAFGGKRIRPIILILLANLIESYDKEKIINSAVSIELIHLASLLHDDVVDENKTRHNLSTAHTLVGNQEAILGGDFLFAESFKKIVKTKNLEIIEIIAEVSGVLASGELQQLQNKINHKTNFEKYFEIIYKKTASLFEATAKIASLIKPSEVFEISGQFGKNVGMAFQVIDDMLDYTSNETKKGVGTDFFESKITLPLILAFESLEKAEYLKLESIFFKESKTFDDFKEVKDLIEKSGAFEKCYKIATEFCSLAKENILQIENKLGKKNSIEARIINDIIDFFLIRKS